MGGDQTVPIIREVKTPTAEGGRHLRMLGRVSSSRRGFLFGVAAYTLWGGFPLYFPLLEPAGAIEILAHRILWSMVTMVLLVLVLRRTRQFRALFRDRRAFALLTLAAAVITFNW